MYRLPVSLEAGRSGLENGSSRDPGGAAGIFSWVGMVLDLAILQKLFGILLILTGLRELLLKPQS